MSRFLVCIVCCPDSTPSIQLQVYPLKHATLPDEVTYSQNTIWFTFAEAESIDDVCRGFVSFRPNNDVEIGQMRLEQKSKNKLYIVGRKVSIDGQIYVHNKFVGTLLPFNEDGKTEVISE